MRPIRIVHLIDSINVGGTEAQCLSLVRALTARGFENTLVYFQKAAGRRELPRGIDGVPISFGSLKRRSGWTGVLRLAAVMRRARADVVQAYGFYSNVPAVIGSRLARIPFTVLSRRDMGEFHSGWTRRLERLSFRFADRVVVNAGAIKTELLSTRQATDAKIVVIRTGVDVSRFPTGTRDTAGSNGRYNGKAVAMAAVFRRQKDHPTLLRAAKLVLSVEPDARFLLAGDGYLREPMERLAAEIGVASAVSFVGIVEPQDMPKFLNASDIVVLASHGNEGVPNAVLEAMAAGKPVVATNTGGCNEAVVDGVTGFLVEPREPKQLADAILRLMENREAAQRMGDAGRARVENQFSLTRMVDQFETLYRCLSGIGQ